MTENIELSSLELKTAVALIRKGILTDERQRWADLGAGNGTFTQALATLLKDGSIIHAVDKDRGALNQIPAVEGREILKIAGDLQKVVSTLPKLDGVLMTNALHFVGNQEVFINKLVKCLTTGGRLVIVEYDTDTANEWIPFPLSFESLCNLIAKTNFSSVERIGEAPSRFQRAGLYAAVVK